MFKYAALLLLALAVSVSAHDRADYEQKFYGWMLEHQVQYDSSSEFVKRLETFIANDIIIEKHNADASQTFTLGHNKFSDLTNEEFRAKYFSPMPADWSSRASATHEEGASTPSSWDWRDYGAVTAVKDQGECGGCWSFSATGGLEGAYQIKHGNLVSFSEQQLVSCDLGPNKNLGCNGGDMGMAYDWIGDNGGLCTEEDYPYTSGTTQQNGDCYTSCSEVSGSAVASFTDVRMNSESAMESAVYQQPTSVGVDASGPTWQFYSGGIVTSDCGNILDHGVLNVGYGTDSGTNYWQVKNSWGSSWGEDGYIRIQKGFWQFGGMCGILLGGVYPSL